MGTPHRLALALDSLQAEHGFVFERFANAFLAAEFPDLRPVGGMHDGGRDAFLHSSESQPDVFFQHSVTESWAAKIRGTVRTLKHNGYDVRELVYCTNREIQREAQGLKAELRKERVALDVRDRAYFLAFSESAPGHSAAAEALAKHMVDPLLVSKHILAAAAPSLTAEEERVATTYLQLELQDRDPQRSLTKVCVEALVLYALREAAPEMPVTRQDIKGRVQSNLRGCDAARMSLLVDNAIQRLVKRKDVRVHKKQDAFVLSYQFREDLKLRVERLLASSLALRDAARKQVERSLHELGIDYWVDVDSVATDAMKVLDHIVHERGRLAAVALVGEGTFATPRKTVDEVVQSLLHRNPPFFVTQPALSNDQIRDILPVVLEKLVAGATPEVEERLRVLADAYCLQFMLQRTPDVSAALGKIVAGVTILIDTSVLLPALAEHFVPAEGQTYRRLVKSAKRLGMRLVLCDDAINEIDTHLDRVAYTHSMSRAPTGGMSAAVYQAQSPIVGAYEDALRGGLFRGAMDDFVELFRGKETPSRDLIEYFASEMELEYDSLTEELAKVRQEDIGTLFDSWKARKRRQPWHDVRAFETLVLHDVRSYLVVEGQRTASTRDGTYSHRWWWLVRGALGFRMDKERHGSAVGRSVCISPDFLARYLSLAPTAAGPTAKRAADSIPPAAVELASLGLVPPELREESQRIYQEAAGQPEYLRRRRLRDLVNRAMATERASQVDDEEAPGEHGP